HDELVLLLGGRTTVGTGATAGSRSSDRGGGFDAELLLHLLREVGRLENAQRLDRFENLVNLGHRTLLLGWSLRWSPLLVLRPASLPRTPRSPRPVLRPPAPAQRQAPLLALPLLALPLLALPRPGPAYRARRGRTGSAAPAPARSSRSDAAPP